MRSTVQSIHRRSDRPGRSRVVVLCLLLAAVASAPGRAAAEGPSEPASAPAPRGEVLFRLHCTSCHGPEGRGDGPLADVLNVPVPDLTRLIEGGEFPEERVARVIDGRAEVAAHGPRQMPIWGLSLRDPGRDSDQEAEVEAGIEALVAYLRSIQADAAGD